MKIVTSLQKMYCARNENERRIYILLQSNVWKRERKRKTECILHKKVLSFDLCAPSSISLHTRRSTGDERYTTGMFVQLFCFTSISCRITMNINTCNYCLEYCSCRSTYHVVSIIDGRIAFVRAREKKK